MNLLILLLYLANMLKATQACIAHPGSGFIQPRAIADCPGAYAPPDTITAVTNARVFTQHGFGDPQTVVFSGGKILSVGDGYPKEATTVVDGAGKFLIPGLIDGHVHPPSCEGLSELAGYGVTTAINMNCQDYENCAAMRDQSGIADFVTASFFAVGSGGQAAVAFGVPQNKTIKPDTNLQATVESAFANGSDFFKIVAEKNGVTQEQQNEIVQLVQGHGRLTATHAVELEFYSQAIKSKSETIQHTPVDGPLSDEQISLILSQNQFVTPTLEFYRIVFGNPLLQTLFGFENYSYDTVEANVRSMHDSGVRIVAGTDAVGSFMGIDYSFGSTLHCELQNLVGAGLSTIEAIVAATSSAAHLYGVGNRGSIEKGKRADLVLLNSSPVDDIKNSFDIASAWIGGIKVKHIMAREGQSC